MIAPEAPAARPLRVVIIGGGIAGLCLAQGLKRAGISFAVYERDCAPDTRLQGYRLNIEPVGAKALQECLPPTLWSRFVAEAGDAGAGMGVYDEGLRLLMREDERRPASPADDTHAVSRVLLRELLRSGLEAELNFGKEFVRYETSGAEVTACFADGSKAGGDVLVGADGVTSRLRRQFLPQARDVDTQGVGIGGKLPLSPATEAWLPPCLLRGKSMILPKRDFLFTAAYRRRDRGSSHRPWLMEAARAEPPSEPDYLLWAYVAHRDTLAPDGEARDGVALRAALETRMATWHKGLRRLLAETDAGTVELFRFRAALPLPPWRNGDATRNVTLMGDAIHAMPPVGGMGGNMALCDASRLCGALRAAARGEAGLPEALGAYEDEMLARGFGAVREARLYLRLAIDPSRLLRSAARLFFHGCGAIPPLRRAVFGGR